MAEPGFDLFGQRLPAARPLGRPRHVPTFANRCEVIRLRHAGLSQDQIAAAIGLTAPTLRLHYRRELDTVSQSYIRRTTGDRRKGNDYVQY